MNLTRPPQDSLSQLLRAAGLHCQCFVHRFDLLNHVRKRPTDAVIIQCQRPDEICQTLIREVDQLPDAPATILHCETYPGPEIIWAFRAGLTDALLTSDDDDATLDVIERAVGAVRRRRRFRGMREEAQTRLQRLNVMQRDVLEHLAEGKTARAIARSLHRSPKTIEYHRARIMLKLRAESLAEVVRMVVIARELADGDAPPRPLDKSPGAITDTIEIENQAGPRTSPPSVSIRSARPP